MPFYRIDRTFPNWTEDDVGAARLRGEMCALHFGGMRWIRSFLDPALSHSICIYEAASEQDVWDHAAEAKLPIDAVEEVVELIPDQAGV